MVLYRDAVCRSVGSRSQQVADPDRRLVLLRNCVLKLVMGLPSAADCRLEPPVW